VFSSWGLTDVGRRRSLNEDTILVEGRLVLVCDGMGGHKAGEVASALAARTVASFIRQSGDDDGCAWPFGFQPESTLEGNLLRTAIKLANRAVVEQAASSDEYTGMGTTLSAALVSETPPQVTYANVGDSRIYLLEQDAIEQLTRDDSWANVVWSADHDDIAPPPNMQHLLTKALGAEDNVEFHVSTRGLSSGNVLLLCSDGLTNMIDDARILEIVRESGFEPKPACEKLLAEANENGGRDNISAIVVRYQA
jgi:serine/threonine protein phosphatase PrpC